nr:SagB/ThcOx family dehydrogenase [Glycomyces sp. L485]
MERRRTCRRFEDAPVDLQHLADILHYSFAPLRFVDAGQMGVLQLRAAASGGARHETDAYVAVFNVADVAPGLYRYDEIRHGLAPVRDEVTRDQMEHLTFHQGFYERAAFGVFTVAMTERFVWKYRHPVAYKLLHHNVGHVAQVFSTVCAAFRLGAAITGAIRNSEADALLGLAGPAEFVTFALACGHPVIAPDGLPGGVQAPIDPWRA